MKIIAVCGQGLGSSLIVEMNLKEVLSNMNYDQVEVGHTNLNSFDPNDSSISLVVCGKDLSDSINFNHKLVLENLFDKKELQVKLEEFFHEKL